VQSRSTEQNCQGRRKKEPPARGVWRAFGEHYFDVVCRKHFQRARKCRFRQSVGIDPQEQRPVNVLKFAVITNRLSDGQDMPLVERHVKRGSAMTGRTEDNALPGIARIGPQLVIGCDEFGDVHKNGWSAGFPAAGLIVTQHLTVIRQENCA